MAQWNLWELADRSARHFIFFFFFWFRSGTCCLREKYTKKRSIAHSSKEILL